MTHLAKHATVGTGDALNSQHRAIRVDRQIHRGHAVCVYVLSSNLTSSSHLRNKLIRRHKATFTMADGHGVYIAHVATRKPRRQARCNARAHKTALMAANGVVGERGTGVVHGANVAEGHKTQLHQRLETIANAHHKAVTHLQQFAHSLGNLGRAEECRDELGRAVGLVAAREAARQHDYLAATDGLYQRGSAFCNALGREVIYYKHLGLRTCALEGARGIVFAVGARENGNDYAGLGHRCARGKRKRGVGANRFNSSAFALIGEHRLHAVFPRLLQLIHGKLFALYAKHVAGSGAAYARDGGRTCLGHVVERATLSKLNDEAAVRGLKQTIGTHLAVQAHANAVAHTHLEQRLGRTPITAGRNRCRAARTNKLFHHVENVFHAFANGQQGIVFPIARRHAHQRSARMLELGRNHAANRANSCCEAHQRRRHVEVFEAARHGVLATDGTNFKVELRHERTQYGSHGLTPALGFVAQALEIFLEGEVGAFVLEASGNELAHAFNHSQIRTAELVGRAKVGVEAPSQARARSGFA